MNAYKKIWFIFFLPILLGGFLFWQGVQADSTSGNLTVGVTIPPSGSYCGDGVKDVGESCDDGVANNGVCPHTCSASCTANSCSGGGDSTAPEIEIISTSTSINGAYIKWRVTDDSSGVSTTTISYGISDYSLSGSVISLGNNEYESNLADLLSGTWYQFRIGARDNNHNNGYKDGQLTTLATPDNTAPLVVGPLQILVGSTTIEFIFDTDEPITAEIDYGLTNEYGSIFSDLNLNTSHDLILFNLSPSTTYYYRLVITDASLNSGVGAVGVTTTLPEDSYPPDVAGFSLATTSASIVLNWVNPGVLLTPNFNGVKLLRKQQSSPDSYDDPTAAVLLNNSFVTSYTDNVPADIQAGIQYYYKIFTVNTSNHYSAGVVRNGMVSPGTDVEKENCHNGEDDDGDGDYDCQDSDCDGDQGCFNEPVAICSDGQDNDGDGLIDYPADPGCESVTGSSEQNQGNIPGFLALNFDNIEFLAGNHQIILTAKDKMISSLAGNALAVRLRSEFLFNPPEEIILGVDNQIYSFVYSTTDAAYYADFALPAVGVHAAYIKVIYSSDQFDLVEFNVNSLKLGVIKSWGEPVSGAQVSLFDATSHSLVLANIFGENNPEITGADGSYGWVIPNGNYYLIAKASGYLDRNTGIFEIKNNIVNGDVDIIKQPENYIETAKAALQAVSHWVDTPIVKDVTAKVAAPVVVGLSAIGTIITIPWLNILLLLRFLFLQPLLLLGRGKRGKWGVVYNSLSKLPVDLALVRLFDANSGRLVRTRVTDSYGRYSFVVDPGSYRLVVTKENLIFPSKLLAGVGSDGRRADIYHGEIIKVTGEDVLISANIPIDPQGNEKPLRRLIWEKTIRKIQGTISIAGLIFTVLALFINPVWYLWVFLVVHISLVLLFRRLIRPRFAKGWGIVSESNTGQPIGRVVARLFNARYNKLVATEITDGRGRYNFLAGDDTYFVTYDHKNFERQQTDPIDLTGKTEDLIARDAKLNKKNGN